MRQFLLSATAFMLSYAAHTQSYPWAYTVHTLTRPAAVAIRTDLQDNIYMATYTHNHFMTLASYLEKRDAEGNRLWQKTFEGSMTIRDMELNASGQLVVIGAYEDDIRIDGHAFSSPGRKSVFLFAADTDGNALWAQSINPLGENESFEPVDLFINHRDEIYFTSEIQGLSGFCAFHKADEHGNLLKNEFNFNHENRTYSNILADSLDNVYISGTCGDFASFDALTPEPGDEQYRHFLVKYDSSFTAKWLLTRPYITFDHNNELQTDGQFLYWAFDEFAGIADTVKILKLSREGEIATDFTAPMSATFFTTPNLSVDPAGNMLLLYTKYQNQYLFYFNNQFEEIWRDTIRTNHVSFAREIDIHCDSSAFYVLAPFFSDTVFIGSHKLINGNTGADFPMDILAFKWSPGAPVSITPVAGILPLTVYPNPASDFIFVGSPLPARISGISVFDVNGTPVQFKKANMPHSVVRIEVKDLPAGMYVLRADDEWGRLAGVARIMVMK